MGGGGVGLCESRTRGGPNRRFGGGWMGAYVFVGGGGWLRGGGGGGVTDGSQRFKTKNHPLTP